MQNGSEDPKTVLSADDRRKIAAEERFRHEIRAKLQRRRHTWVWWLAGGLVVAWLFGVLLETGPTPRSAPDSAPA
jgi:hypothetical protein